MHDDGELGRIFCPEADFDARVVVEPLSRFSNSALHDWRPFIHGQLSCEVKTRVGKSNSKR